MIIFVANCFSSLKKSLQLEKSISNIQSLSSQKFKFSSALQNKHTFLQSFQFIIEHLNFPMVKFFFSEIKSISKKLFVVFKCYRKYKIQVKIIFKMDKMANKAKIQQSQWSSLTY